ncbi:hypothetical protein UlMin_017478 [Ulmus minor]
MQLSQTLILNGITANLILLAHLSQIKTHFHNSNPLKIAIISFGNFSQFLARAFVRQGHTVLAHSRSDYSLVAQTLGVAYFSDPHDLCEQHPEVVLLCTSILSFEKVIQSIPFQSSKFSWVGLPFVYDKVGISNNGFIINRCEQFLNIFAREGCRMVEMSCAVHDRHAAGSQFVAHTMGRLLERFRLESSPINTKGYETLLNLVDNTAGDSFDLYYGLFMYNKNAMEQLEKLEMAFEALKKKLSGAFA